MKKTILCLILASFTLFCAACGHGQGMEEPSSDEQTSQTLSVEEIPSEGQTSASDESETEADVSDLLARMRVYTPEKNQWQLEGESTLDYIQAGAEGIEAFLDVLESAETPLLSDVLQVIGKPTYASNTSAFTYYVWRVVPGVNVRLVYHERGVDAVVSEAQFIYKMSMMSFHKLSEYENLYFDAIIERDESFFQAQIDSTETVY